MRICNTIFIIKNRRDKSNGRDASNSADANNNRDARKNILTPTIAEKSTTTAHHNGRDATIRTTATKAMPAAKQQQ